MSPIARRTSDATFDALVRHLGAHGGPPESFLRYRRNELDLILAQAGVELGGIVLEIGGGISGHSFLLTDLASRVICTDLLNTTTVHGGDFAQAAALARADAKGRLAFVCGRGQQIPLRDGSVDVVFSSFVFEHIPDRAATVREIRRVLRTGGVVITNVPNRPEQLFRALRSYFVDAPRQIVKATILWTPLRSMLGARVRSPAARPRTRAEFGGWLRGVLTYRVHGEYPSHLAELVRSSPGTWDALFEREGFVIERRFTNNLEYYVAFFSEGLTQRVQRWLMPVVTRWGRRWPLRSFGQSYCFVASKPSPR